MEYVPGGDLGNYVNQHSSLPEYEVKAIARQLLSALKYLHEGGITHRDVKPDNILVSNCNPLQVKLTDFGLSKMIDSEETFLRTFCGTLLYCAPEVYCEYREFDENGKRTLRGQIINNSAQRYGNAVDIWSLAGVLFYSLCCRPPYPVENLGNYLDLLTRIMSQPLDIRPLQHANVSDNGIRFIRQMLHIRPEHRATIEDLEMSSWLRDDRMQSPSECDTSFFEITESLPHLAESASQLSICDRQNTKFKHKMPANYGDNDSLQISNMEIPCSFDTSQNLSWLLDTYELSTSPLNRRKINHLFGELTGVCLASSSVIPFNQINLPLSCRENLTNLSHNLENAPQNCDPNSPKQENEVDFMQVSSLPDKQDNNEDFMQLSSLSEKQSDFNQPLSCVSGNSCLFDSQFLAGNMKAFDPKMLNNENSDQIDGRDLRSTTISLRRPREEDLETVLSSKRRRGSAPRSHHFSPSFEVSGQDVPRIPPKKNLKPMCNGRHDGESFKDQDKIFGVSKKGSTLITKQPRISDIEASDQTNSESPIGNFHQLASRDHLTVSKISTSDNFWVQSETVTSKSFALNSKYELIESPLPPAVVQKGPSGSICQPKALARLVATFDSCLPSIEISITDFVTIWGRGSKTSIPYHDVTESRIPKYAFKIFLYKPNYYNNIKDLACCHVSCNDVCQDMSFYISTKASVGIWINDTYLPSHDRQNPNTESKYWGRVNHGDLITVWRHDSKPRQIFTRFRFECNWGQSNFIRKSGDLFELIQDIEYLKDLESSCKKLEKFASSSTHFYKTNQQIA